MRQGPQRVPDRPARIIAPPARRAARRQLRRAYLTGASFQSPLATVTSTPVSGVKPK